MTPSEGGSILTGGVKEMQGKEKEEKEEVAKNRRAVERAEVK